MKLLKEVEKLNIKSNKTKKEFLKYVNENYFKFGGYYIDKDIAGCMPEYAPPNDITEIYNSFIILSYE